MPRIPVLRPPSLLGRGWHTPDISRPTRDETDDKKNIGKHMENCVLNWDLTIKTCGFSWMKKKCKHKKTLDVRVIYSNWFYHEQLGFDHQT
jgi:hypothetical protein